MIAKYDHDKYDHHDHTPPAFMILFSDFEATPMTWYNLVLEPIIPLLKPNAVRKKAFEIVRGFVRYFVVVVVVFHTYPKNWFIVYTMGGACH